MSYRLSIRRKGSLSNEIIFSFIYTLLKASATEAKRLVEMLERRKLFKRAVNLDLTWSRDVPDPRDKKMLADMTKEDMETLSEEIAKRIQEPVEYVIVKRREISIKLYEEGEILVYDENKDRTYDLYELSPI